MRRSTRGRSFARPACVAGGTPLFPQAQGALAAHHYAGALVEASLIDLSDGYKSYFVGLSKKLPSDYGPAVALAGTPCRPSGTGVGDHRAKPRPAAHGRGRAPSTRARVYCSPIQPPGTSSRNSPCHRARIVAGFVNLLRAGDQIVAVSCQFDVPRRPLRMVHRYDHDMGEVLARQAGDARHRGRGHATRLHPVRTRCRSGLF